jgi:8-oxo-dGTP pyrophosphatase MutT (NUDIX family)
MMPIAKALCNVSKENREKDYQIAKEKFESLKKGIRISRNEMMMEYTLENLIKMSKYEYRTSEWGFPKGRRNMREKNIDCANREFQEETNLKENDYQVVNLSPIEEVFRGINGTLYKHIYYISQACRKLELKMDKENYHQVIEFGNIQWFTLNQSLDAIREYNIEKRNLIINTHNMLKSIFFLFKELLVNLLKGYKGQKE